MSLHDSKKKRHGPIRVFKNVWFMFRYTFRYTPGYIWVTLTEAIGRGIWHILEVLYVKYLFDAIEQGRAFREILFSALLLIAYNSLFEFFNKWMLNVYRPKANYALHEGMQKELYRKAVELDQSCYDDPEFYNDFIWAIRESDARTAQMMIDLSIFLNRIIATAAIFGVLVSMEWVVAVILLLALIFGFTIRTVINKRNYAMSLEQNVIGRKLSYISRIFYLPEYAKELRQGEIGETLEKRYCRTVDERIECNRKWYGKTAFLWFFESVLSGQLAQLGVMGYMIVRKLTDPLLSLGVFAASANASMKLYWQVNSISHYLNRFNEHSLYVEKFRKFVNYEPAVKGDLTDVPPFETLTLRNLQFSYPFSKEGEAVLKSIDLEIKKGEKIAFVGYNGAGKTTLIKLLMRLYDATEGEILYNGRSITEFDPKSYRKHIGAVFQDYKVFAATVAENVLDGEYTPDQEERVHRALCAASFEDRLASMPQGIHTPLTREFDRSGVALSGGESQKIAIARVFARDYDLMILDEPSSALDPLAEYALNRSILENAGDKTVIFISHRLSTTRMADRIYMFENGSVIEVGSHGELMEQKGKYAEMFRTQAKKYRTERQE